MRLQRYIAMCGITSRRKAENLILDGRVKVDGKIIYELGVKVNNKNKVEVDGKLISLEDKKVYILLNKPVGYVTTLDDERNRKTVIDLVPQIKERIYPVGRLDLNTSGVLILTNDGDLTYKLTHPSFQINKTYIALIEGIPSRDDLVRFSNGLFIDDYLTSPCKVRLIKTYKSDSLIEVIIHEGRNRQVRKMCSKIGHPVKKLKRINFGGIGLEDLSLGNWRHLSNEEIELLRRL